MTVLVAVTVTISIMMITIMMATIMMTATALEFVLCRSDKVHRPVAGMIPMAVLAPFFRMSRRYMHVKRGNGNRLRLPDDNHRLRIHKRRRRIANVHTAIYPRCDLSGKADVDIDVPPGMSKCGDLREQYSSNNLGKRMTHGDSFFGFDNPPGLAKKACRVSFAL